jgi:hypothetical protein
MVIITFCAQEVGGAIGIQIQKLGAVEGGLHPLQLARPDGSLLPTAGIPGGCSPGFSHLSLLHPWLQASF